MVIAAMYRVSVYWHLPRLLVCLEQQVHERVIIIVVVIIYPYLFLFFTVLCILFFNYK